MKNAIRALLLACLCGEPLLAPALAFADETSGDDDWQFQFTGYGWMTSLSGKVGVEGYDPQKVDVSFREMLQDLDGALMGAFYVKKGSWMLLTDFIWAKVSDKQTVDSLGGELKYQQTQILASAIVGYELPLGVPDLHFNATAGLRYQRLQASLDFNDTALGPVLGDREGAVAWTDPTLGVFLRYDLSEHWFLNGLADVGGFGLGSKISTQGYGAVGYAWNESITTSVGYRVLYIDYDKGGFSYDATMYGPMIGLGIRF